jgi:hypothetical protein
MSIKNKYIGILLIATMMLLSACSSDNPEAQTVTTVHEPVGKEVQLMSYASPFTDQELSHRAAPAGFTAYTPDKTTNMGVYMLLSENPATDWASPEEGRITYNPNTNKWNAYFEVKKNKTFTVYGYMPKTGEMGSALTKSTADEATLTITGMKAITTDDICIITGVKDSETGLKEGSFSWRENALDDDYYIYMLLNHLYASLRFSMKVDATYAELRTIKLKSMTLSTNQSSVDAAITLIHNTTGAMPITNVSYTSTGSDSEVVIFSDDDGLALSPVTPKVIDGCFAPTLSGNLTLTTSYDVYDRYGNLVRANCTATNKLPILEATRGQRLQLNLTVSPTYLYVLSDPDLDNPTIKIS